MTLLPTHDMLPSAAQPTKRWRWRPTTWQAFLILSLSLALSLHLYHSIKQPVPPALAAAPTPPVRRKESAVLPDGGACEALGPLRPTWACPEEMRAALPHFLSVYDRRPVRQNAGGMRFDHSFALWYTLRTLNPPPRTVIESGAFNGQSTWLIREALPRAKVFSLDPLPPRRKLSGVHYLTDKLFKDFNSVDWNALGVDADHTLVFFDDHQSGFRRIVREAMKHGFWRFITEDNYPYLKGDNMSLKWVCEVSRKSLWPGVVKDNFGKVKTKQTWEEHLKLTEELRNVVKTYYEFPPVATSALTGQTRFDEMYASKPLLSDEEAFKRISKGLDRAEFHMYTHFSYIETRRSP